MNNSKIIFLMSFALCNAPTLGSGQPTFSVTTNQKDSTQGVVNTQQSDTPLTPRTSAIKYALSDDTNTQIFSLSRVRGINISLDSLEVIIANQAWGLLKKLCLHDVRSTAKILDGLKDKPHFQEFSKEVAGVSMNDTNLLALYMYKFLGRKLELIDLSFVIDNRAWGFLAEFYIYPESSSASSRCPEFYDISNLIGKLRDKPNFQDFANVLISISDNNNLFKEFEQNGVFIDAVKDNPNYTYFVFKHFINAFLHASSVDFSPAYCTDFFLKNIEHIISVASSSEFREMLYIIYTVDSASAKKILDKNIEHIISAASSSEFSEMLYTISMVDPESAKKILDKNIERIISVASSSEFSQMLYTISKVDPESAKKILDKKRIQPKFLEFVLGRSEVILSSDPKLQNAEIVKLLVSAEYPWLMIDWLNDHIEDVAALSPDELMQMIKKSCGYGHYVYDQAHYGVFKLILNAKGRNGGLVELLKEATKEKYSDTQFYSYCIDCASVLESQYYSDILKLAVELSEQEIYLISVDFISSLEPKYYSDILKLVLSNPNRYKAWMLKNKDYILANLNNDALISLINRCEYWDEMLAVILSYKLSQGERATKELLEAEEKTGKKILTQFLLGEYK